VFGLLLLSAPANAVGPGPRSPRTFLGLYNLPRLFIHDIHYPEIMQMLWAVAHGSQMGPGEGWFHPGTSRYTWKWLADRHGVARNGRIPRKKFQGPSTLFDRLDRNHDGVLTPDDFDWSERSAFLRQNRMASMWFSRLDSNSNGRVSREEWDAFFAWAARGKKYLTPEDLRAALAPPAPPPRGARSAGGPSPLIFVKGLLSGELGSIHEGPSVGEAAPDFTLPTPDGKKKYRLSQYRGRKPVVLVFGSFT
jgi:hypothetical protein